MKFERRLGMFGILAVLAAPACEEGPKYHPKDGGTDADAPAGSGGGGATTAGRGSGGVGSGSGGLLGTASGGSVGASGSGGFGGTGNGGASGSGASAGAIGNAGASAGASAGATAGGNGTGGVANGSGGATGGGAGRASTGGTGGVSSTGGTSGGGSSGQGCLSTQHTCGGSCVDDSVAHCGSSCMMCSAPAGGTAVCSGGMCDFTCGAMKKCGQKCIATSDGQCCTDQDCLNGFGCAAGVCKKSCSTSSDCQPDYFCDVGNAACHSDVVSVACGTSHKCAALKDGRVMCWGDNTAGQLGVGTTNAAQGAVPVHGVTKAALVRANEYTTCVLTSDGTVSCWGNYFGDTPATFLASTTSIPVTTSTGPLSGVKVLEVGYNDGCAVAGAGVYCWGRSASASLGIDPSQQDVYPATLLVGAGIPSSLGMGQGLQVAAYGSTSVCPWSGQTPQGQCFDIGGKVAQLALGQQTTCARRDDGVVICWGANDYGQVGPGGKGATVDPPGVQVPGLKASDLVVGGDFGCAIKSDDPRTIACWGHTSSAVRFTTPDIATGLQLAKLGSGEKAFSFCGVLTDGRLLCWDYSGTPQQVPSTW